MSENVHIVYPERDSDMGFGLNKVAVFTLGFAWLVLVGANAEAKIAKCVISQNRTEIFRGPCKFTGLGEGSFSIDPVKGDYPIDEISTISVSVQEVGVAEVRGLTSAGNNSRWGTAVRSQSDKACWNGTDFAICVY